MRPLTITLALFAIVAGASADNLRAQIDANNKKIGKAMVKKDLKSFERIVRAGITSDFKYSEQGQTMTFDQMFSTMKASFETIKKIDKATTTTVKFSQKGNSARVESKHFMSGIMISPDKKSHKFTMTGVSIDSFRKVGKEWKMSSMEWKNNAMTLDGKPFQMSGG